VEVVIRGQRLEDSGVLVDFGEVKQATREVLIDVDHHYLNELAFFKDLNPSSENIARYLFQELAKRLDNEDRRIYRVSAWESADACATYLGDNA
jgi:6-pyruvoyltetrahydropterin/6-carboxytetrahydropterin synthase